MTLQISWQEAPIYPALIKGPAGGTVDSYLLVAGGMSYPWREVEYGFAAPIQNEADEGQNEPAPIGEWYPLPYGIASHRVAVWQNCAFLVGNETRDSVRGNTYGTVFAGQIRTD